MMATIQKNEAYELTVSLTRTRFGHSLMLASTLHTARRPEPHVKFQGLFTDDQLRTLRDLIDKELQS